jgi:hypothetical protein
LNKKGSWKSKRFCAERTQEGESRHGGEEGKNGDMEERKGMIWRYGREKENDMEMRRRERESSGERERKIASSPASEGEDWNQAEGWMRAR